MCVRVRVRVCARVPRKECPPVCVCVRLFALLWLQTLPGLEEYLQQLTSASGHQARGHGSDFHPSLSL